MQEEIKLGIIGLSEGNGHPYSWSAIFNGYTPEFMESCDFPVIPRYLEKQTFPDDCIKGAKVTHIWTQDKCLSQKVAKASNIENIVENMEDMIGEVDAILLARDDSEKHYEMAKPFILAKLPIYIDKPLSTSLEDAKRIYELESYDGQIFTCSALAFAQDLDFVENIGEIKYIEATTPKDWNKYGIHIIEPALKLFNYKSKITNITTNTHNAIKTVIVNYENGITLNLKAIDNCKSPIKINVYGTIASKEIFFNNTFNAFKNALTEFISIIRKTKINSSKDRTLAAIKIIEGGNK